MAVPGSNDGQTIFATLRYKDASAAIAFLTEAFGFTEVVAYRDEDGGVAHAQLAYGTTSVMLGQARDSEYDRLLGEPTPNALYVVVEDTDAHHARAKETGAEIVMGPSEQPHGSYDYLARDPEGNLWSFGTYGGAA